MPLEHRRRELRSIRLLPWALAAASLLVSARPATAGPPPRPLDLTVDASDAPRGRFHAQIVIPASPGPLTLAYPKWIQGEHSPSGPIGQLAGPSIAAGTAVVPWHRDPFDPFLFRLEVPAGADSVRVELDYLPPLKVFGAGYGTSPNSTPHLLIVDWHDLVLYPATAAADELTVRARLRLPAGWRHDEALAPQADPDGTLLFPTVSLTTLIDSPVLAGDHFRTEVIDAGDPPTRLSIAADRASSLAVSAERLAAYRQLTREAQALFGARHYRSYHWLMALGDTLEENGLEHHESTDIRDAPGLYTDPDFRLSADSTSAHEYVHSWNGKYRRPAGLVPRNLNQPLDTELLWVYEGLTRYLGDVVLTARSGQWTAEQVRDYLAFRAARQDRARPGRAWRPLVDTAVAAQLVYAAASEWISYLRSADFYDESMLVWLEVDTIARQQSGGRLSLDDFCRDFFGGGDGPPAVRTYTRADVEAALGKLVPFDWHRFFTARIYDVRAEAPLDGFANAGWKLVYDQKPNALQRARAKVSKILDHSLDIGLVLDPAGLVEDVVFDSAAWKGGLGPGMKVIAVAGRKLTPEVLDEELAAALQTTTPIAITVEHGEDVEILHVDYHGGVLFPHLERDPSRPDLLTQILAPRVEP